MLQLLSACDTLAGVTLAVVTLADVTLVAWIATLKAQHVCPCPCSLLSPFKTGAWGERLVASLTNPAAGRFPESQG